MQISHSAVETYDFCSESYKLKYLLKYRPITTSSNLIWGGAIDEGLNELLKTKLEKDPEILPTPLKNYMEKWETCNINGVDHDAKFCTLIEYNKKDLDPNLFTDLDRDEIKKFYPDLPTDDFITQIQDLREQFPWWSYAEMPETSKKAYNFLCWLSLARKAAYIFEAYRVEVLPQIKRVFTIQRKVELENTNGDTIIGYIDFIAEMQDGKTYVLDNKTASDFKYYNPDKETGLSKVHDSSQLNLYTFEVGLKNAGYIVILKDIKADGRKKGSIPKVKIKVILDAINEARQNEVLNKFHLINTKIQDKIFNKKVETVKEAEDMQKGCYQFGKKCPFWNYCWNNKDMTGLIKKE